MGKNNPRKTKPDKPGKQAGEQREELPPERRREDEGQELAAQEGHDSRKAAPADQIDNEGSDPDLG